jgi:hypothetical protein
MFVVVSVAVINRDDHRVVVKPVVRFQAGHCIIKGDNVIRRFQKLYLPGKQFDRHK